MFFFHSCFKKRKILSLSLTKGREGGTTQFPEITPSRLKNEKQHQHIEPYYMHCYTRAKFLQILSSFPWVTEERQPGIEGLGKAFRGQTVSLLRTCLVTNNKPSELHGSQGCPCGDWGQQGAGPMLLPPWPAPHLSELCQGPAWPLGCPDRKVG